MDKYIVTAIVFQAGGNRRLENKVTIPIVAGSAQAAINIMRTQLNEQLRDGTITGFEPLTSDNVRKA